MKPWKSSFLVACTLVAASAALALVLATPAQAQHRTLSEVSAVSVLPVVVSVAVPTMLVVGSGALTVVAVEASADGTVWVLERASDGMRGSLRIAGQVSQAVGSSIEVVAHAAGSLLCSGGKVLAIVPNETGARLLHRQRLTP
jgi:hypothetical protein